MTPDLEKRLREVRHANMPQPVPPARRRALLTFIAAAALLMHGVGHVLFLANSWGFWRDGDGRTWLFAAPGAAQITEQAISVMWLVPLVGFVAVAAGYLAQQAWWPGMAITSATVSLALLVLWWGGLNVSSALFAAVFDAMVIAVVVWQRVAAAAPA